ncbi:MAG: trypsin-like serine protease [Clostridia bacterium]|nr:trypsin-like serine protease [Clostridia bacterium]
MVKKKIFRVFGIITMVAIISLFSNVTSFASLNNSDRKAYYQEEKMEGIIEANLETREEVEKTYEEILSEIPTSYANDTNTHVEACPPIDVPSPAVIVGGEDGRVTTSDPAICALEITWSDGCRSGGTGFMIGPDLVATAGHCVYAYHGKNGHPAHQLAASIKVIPGRQGNVKPYGEAYASNVVYETTWKSSGNNAEDWGLIKLNKTIKACGSFGFAYSEGYDGWVNRYVTVTGYPKPQDNNWQLYTHREQVKRARYLYMIYAVDTEGGQSGSPVTEDGTGYAIGIHHGGDDIEGTNYNVGINITKERFNTFLRYR